MTGVPDIVAGEYPARATDGSRRSPYCTAGQHGESHLGFGDAGRN